MRFIVLFLLLTSCATVPEYKLGCKDGIKDLVVNENSMKGLNESESKYYLEVVEKVSEVVCSDLQFKRDQELMKRSRERNLERRFDHAYPTRR